MVHVAQLFISKAVPPYKLKVFLYVFLLLRKCFNPSASSRFFLKIRENVAEGFENQTFQKGSALVQSLSLPRYTLTIPAD